MEHLNLQIETMESSKVSGTVAKLIEAFENDSKNIFGIIQKELKPEMELWKSKTYGILENVA